MPLISRVEVLSAQPRGEAGEERSIDACLVPQLAAMPGIDANSVDNDAPACLMPGPHDRLVKRILSEPKNAAAELVCILPADIAASVDWASLKLENAAFVDDELRDRYADLVFTARVADRQSFIYVLIEHQSETDRFITFRILNYMVRIWARVVAAEPPPKQLPPVLPVLLAHARSDSASEAAPVVFSELLDVPPELLAKLQSRPRTSDSSSTISIASASCYALDSPRW